MTPQKQAFRHYPTMGIYGDCYRTAIACLLDLPRDEVPHFGAGGPSGPEFQDRVKAFLGSRGLREVVTMYPADGRVEDILYTIARFNPDLHYMLGGRSRTGCNHVVICRNNVIVWDTSLNDAGIIGPMDDGWYWISFLGLVV